MGWCQAPGCDRETPPRGGSYCEAHWKQKQRGRALTPIAEVLTPKERVVATGSEHLEAEDDQEYIETERPFLRACEVWLRTRGWKPPTPRRPRQQEPEDCPRQLPLPLLMRRPSKQGGRLSAR